jgi:hypothetical protein
LNSPLPDQALRSTTKKPTKRLAVKDDTAGDRKLRFAGPRRHGDQHRPDPDGKVFIF